MKNSFAILLLKGEFSVIFKQLYVKNIAQAVDVTVKEKGTVVFGCRDAELQHFWAPSELFFSRIKIY